MGVVQFKMSQLPSETTVGDADASRDVAKEVTARCLTCCMVNDDWVMIGEEMPVAQFEMSQHFFWSDRCNNRLRTLYSYCICLLFAGWHRLDRGAKPVRSCIKHGTLTTSVARDEKHKNSSFQILFRFYAIRVSDRFPPCFWHSCSEWLINNSFRVLVH
jgi:hypothetical protein